MTPPTEAPREETRKTCGGAWCVGDGCAKCAALNGEPLPPVCCSHCGRPASHSVAIHVCACGRSYNCRRRLVWLAKAIAAYRRTTAALTRQDEPRWHHV